MTLAPGTRLGHFEVLSPLGAGGMGEVYRARDPRLGRDVAIKVLPPSFSADADRLRRFEQEAKAAGILNHPNITAVHDLGTHDGSPYVVQELLEGETLRTILAAGPLPVRKAVDYALQIARGLSAAHGKGIVHRDLKPENVFVTNDGRVKILDFGLAKLTHVEEAGQATNLPTATAATEPGVVLGTLGYMSPEQVRGKPADARSDIFAFGAILYEMLSGNRAFRGDSAADTMSAILREEPPEISLTNRNVPPGLERIVRHCLEKNPEQRFHSAHDLAFDLDALSTVSSAGALAPAAPSRARTRRFRTAALAAAAIAAIVLAYALGIRRGAGARPADPSFAQLTFRQQPIFTARFTPDGRTIVYSTAPSGNTPEIHTMRPEFPGASKRVISGAQLLAVSSKGELAVLTKPEYRGHSLFAGTLARMPLEGAAPREVRTDVREVDWTPDGSDLAIVRDVDGRDHLEYPPGKVLATTGGYFSHPRFSPKGDRIAFFEHPIRFDDRGSVAVIDLAGKKTTLSEGYWGLEGLAWSRDGVEVLYAGGTAYNNFRVFAVDLSGRRRVALQSAGGMTIHDVAADGRWLTTRDDYLRNMMVYRAGWPAPRDLSWMDLSQPVALSADGERLLFSEESGAMGANYAAAIRETEGPNVVRLGDGDAVDLSPDGKWALASLPASTQALFLYPIGAGEARKLDAGSIVSFATGGFFPDGRRILFEGAEAGRAARCWAQDLAGGKPRPVTPEGAGGCWLSPDGLRIASREKGALYVYPSGGGEPARVPGSDDAVVARWGAGGRSLLVFEGGKVPARIERLEIETGKRTPVLTLGPADLTAVTAILPIVVGADEKSHAYTARRTFSQLFLVENAR